MFRQLKAWWERLRRDRGRLTAAVRVDFYPQKAATSHMEWHTSQPQERDPVTLAVFFYARLLFELAELNETRVANELITFISQVADLVLQGGESPHRPRLPLGGLQLRPQSLADQPSRSYEAKLYRLQDGQFRLEFSGSLGKEGVYLPAAYVVFLQDCINELEPENLLRLAHSLRRLHEFYRTRTDFWEAASLTAGPIYALSGQPEASLRSQPSEGAAGGGEEGEAQGDRTPRDSPTPEETT